MPEKQGTLDALCGIYAVINAINLVQNLRKTDRRYLFHHLMSVLSKASYLDSALLHGTYKRHITMMLDAAAHYMRGQHNTEISAKPLFRTNTGITAKNYFRMLEDFLASERRAVIINLQGRLYHWSVVKEVSEISIWLEDSYGYTHIRKRSCAIIEKQIAHTGHILIPRQTWGLSIIE